MKQTARSVWAGQILKIAYSLLFLVFAVRSIIPTGSMMFQTQAAKVVLFAVLSLALLLGLSRLLAALGPKRAAVLRCVLAGAAFCAQFTLFWKTVIAFGWDAILVDEVALAGFFCVAGAFIKVTVVIVVIAVGLLGLLRLGRGTPLKALAAWLRRKKRSGLAV